MGFIYQWGTCLPCFLRKATCLLANVTCASTSCPSDRQGNSSLPSHAHRQTTGLLLCAEVGSRPSPLGQWFSCEIPKLAKTKASWQRAAGPCFSLPPAHGPDHHGLIPSCITDVGPPREEVIGWSNTGGIARKPSHDSYRLQGAYGEYVVGEAGSQISYKILM